MALSRKTKKMLKAYVSWKVLTKVAKFGALPVAGAVLFNFFKDKDDAHEMPHAV